MKIIFCQKCGDALPNSIQPIALKTRSIQSPEHPNRSLMGRIDMVFRCPHCREKIILVQQHFKSLAAANEQALLVKAKLEAEGQEVRIDRQD